MFKEVVLCTVDSSTKQLRAKKNNSVNPNMARRRKEQLKRVECSRLVPIMQGTEEREKST